MTTKNDDPASAWVDPDDAPELTEEWFERAEWRIGDKPAPQGQPGAKSPTIPHRARISACAAPR